MNHYRNTDKTSQRPTRIHTHNQTHTQSQRHKRTHTCAHTHRAKRRSIKTDSVVQRAWCRGGCSVMPTALLNSCSIQPGYILLSSQNMTAVGPPRPASRPQRLQHRPIIGAKIRLYRRRGKSASPRFRCQKFRKKS